MLQKVIKIYSIKKGKEPLNEWLKNLRDGFAKLKILRRIDRVALGNYRDYRFISGSLFELKIDYRPGYRVYCGEDGDKIIVLLCAGDKKKQDLDIKKAKEYWEDYLLRRKL